jgi:hypothetical protein
LAKDLPSWHTLDETSIVIAQYEKLLDFKQVVQAAVLLLVCAAPVGTGFNVILIHQNHLC